MSIDCNPRAITKNLILYLDSENEKSYLPESTDWLDISGHQNDFRMFGIIPMAGKYFTLTPSISDYFVSRHLFPHPTTEATFEMWCKPAASTTSYAFWSFTAELFPAIYQSVYNQKSVTLYGPVSPPAGIPIITGQTVEDDGWKHIVRTSIRSTIDPLKVPGTESLYINGQLAFSRVVNPNVNFVNNGVLLIGQKPDLAGFLDITTAFSGQLSIFKVYNTALTSDEVFYNFNALRQRYDLIN